MIDDPTEAKRALRALLRGDRGGDDASLRHQLLSLAFPPGGVIAGVWPLPGEPDLSPAWAELHRRGHVVSLPETTRRGEPLLFHVWQPGDTLLPGRFGTSHPPGPTIVPGLVFVPLLCWDEQLNRLGYGGGYYDRTLAALPEAQRIGYGFEAQRVGQVPVGPHDITLDAMVTESRILFAKERRS